MVSGINLMFTFSLQQVQSKLHVSIHSCTNDYLRCTKCEVHDRVCKHVIRCMKKRVTRFLIFEALIGRPHPLAPPTPKWLHPRCFSQNHRDNIVISINSKVSSFIKKLETSHLISYNINKQVPVLKLVLQRAVFLSGSVGIINFSSLMFL